MREKKPMLQGRNMRGHGLRVLGQCFVGDLGAEKQAPKFSLTIIHIPRIKTVILVAPLILQPVDRGGCWSAGKKEPVSA
ncbi:hypothetical protein MNBD_GAMMA17-634, partial [hydrothermal vent metagenome]